MLGRKNKSSRTFKTKSITRKKKSDDIGKEKEDEKDIERG